MSSSGVLLRRELRPGDDAAIAAIVHSSGFFSPDEERIAVDLAEDRLENGEESSYRFIVAEVSGQVTGYTCWGHIDGTRSSFDLYWIAVLESGRGKGLGRLLMAETERAVAQLGGGRIYAETSSRDQYQPTRSFYERCGYRAEALIEDFYAPGDGKVIYVQVVSAIGEPQPFSK